MKKLSLALDELVVESFATGGESRREGTVHGHGGYTPRCDTVNATCDFGDTCGGATCGGVAENTCAPSCDTCDVYRCGTLQGYDCTNYLNCMSDDGQCATGVQTACCG